MCEKASIKGFLLEKRRSREIVSSQVTKITSISYRSLVLCDDDEVIWFTKANRRNEDGTGIEVRSI